MKDPDLVRPEGTDNSVQESSIMEEDEVVLLPIVWVYKLFVTYIHEGGRHFTGYAHLLVARWLVVAFCTAARGLERDP